MTVYEHIAINNHNKAAGLVTSLGLRPFRDPQMMAEQLKGIVRESGGDGLRKVMSIHPDKEIILEMFGTKKNADGEDGFANACGCGCGGSCGGGMNASGGCGCGSNNADGDTQPVANKSALGTVPVSTILIGVMMVTALVVLVRIK